MLSEDCAYEIKSCGMILTLYHDSLSGFIAGKTSHFIVFRVQCSPLQITVNHKQR